MARPGRATITQLLGQYKHVAKHAIETLTGVCSIARVEDSPKEAAPLNWQTSAAWSEAAWSIPICIAMAQLKDGVRGLWLIW